MDQTTSLERSQLLELIRQKSYREGDFTLASGKKSSFYIDLKATALHPDGAYLTGRLIVSLAMGMGLPPIEGAGGLTLGADPIATAVSLAAREKKLHWPAFIVRKEPKEHGTSRWVEGTENLRKGAQVLVVEDVATTGGSSLKAVQRLKESGYLPSAVIAMVDREEGAKEAFAQAGIPFGALFTLREIQKK